MSSIWSITLALISLSAGEALYTRAQGLGGALVVLFMLVAFAAWLFERYIKIIPPHENAHILFIGK
ncbi:hypothetical protein [Raoultella terrigena]|uniref:hypothetical protein n=1 Tax=Raoultella terrigena TaxID=577 RepID=UPI00349F3F48